MLVLSEKHPLAHKDTIYLEDLTPYIEIAHADPYVPSLSASAVMKEERATKCNRHIYVFERGGQFHLLAQNPQTFMWVSPLPNEVIDSFGLVQKPCIDNKKRYKDMLIYHKDYRLSELDKRFITELCTSKRKYL